MQLVIVESPAKAKTIEKYLGPGFKVLASYGHIRDLPPKDGSVDPENGFEMLWDNYADKAKQLKAITDEAKKADGSARNFALGGSAAQGGPGAGLTALLKKRREGAPFFYWFGSHHPHRAYPRDSGIDAGKKPSEIDRVPAYWPDNEIVRRDMLDALAKLNGYQSLHTTIVGPSGLNVEFQMRTEAMHLVAETGVAAHWLYKDKGSSNEANANLGNKWLQSLLDIQDETRDATEFWDHVKVDLFPDAVYVFTPKGQIRALPRGATALDFAYSIHSDVGNTCVAVKINGMQLPLRSELKNSDIVEVVTSANSQPNPGWLAFVRTGKARASIRHSLKTKHYAESLQLGERLLASALRQQGVDAGLLSPELWEKLLHWTGDKTREEACVNIALGRRSSQELAIRLKILIDDEGGSEQMRLGATDWVSPLQEIASHHHQRQAILVDGREGNSISFQTCCHPIPGDNIIGYLGKGEGLQVHTNDCSVALRMLSKDSDKWVEVEWGKEVNREFEVDLAIDTHQGKGVLARVASSVTAADSNIMNVSMDDRYKEDAVTIRFTIQVSDRLHLSRVMRSLRANQDVMRVTRVRVG